jgi:hypothetical protein
MCMHIIELYSRDVRAEHYAYCTVCRSDWSMLASKGVIVSCSRLLPVLVQGCT